MIQNLIYILASNQLISYSYKKYNSVLIFFGVTVYIIHSEINASNG